MNPDDVITDLVYRRSAYQVAETIGTGDQANSAAAEIRNPHTDEQFLIRVERVSGPGPHTMQADLAIRALVKLLAEDWRSSQQIVPAVSEAYLHNTSPAELDALRAQVGNQTIAEFLGCQGHPHCHCLQEGASAGVESGNTSKSG